MKKKEKKVNSEEKKENGKDDSIKIRWKTWMTVVAVIAGVLLVSGITVLGVFLAGGFDEKFIYPEAITYQYDENLLNTDNGYLEIDEDITLVITTETPEVTRKSVTLSFGREPLRPSNGYISDGTIIIPEYVQIGTPFTVRRATTHIVDKDGNTQDWFAGGLSTIYATSENSEIDGDTPLHIAVDVPVYQTETVIVNSKGEETSTIVINESFTAKTKFYPANSQWLYSDDVRYPDDENARRAKKSYFEQVDTNDITSIYDSRSQMHFVASENKVNNIKINGYTFIMAKSQLEYEEDPVDFGDAGDNYRNALTYLSDNVDLSKMATATFNIDDEDIGYFNVNREGQNVSMRINEELNLYLNQFLYASNSDYLGVSVYSASGLILDNLLQNIAVTFERLGFDPTIGTNRILTVTGAGDPVEIDNVTYYRPMATGTDKRYSYWKLLATETADIKMRVVLLVNGDDGLKLFKPGLSETPLVRDVNLIVTKHEEKPVSWVDQTDLKILLDYTNEGGISTLKPAPLNLEPYAFVPTDNIYQDKVFFISFGKANLADEMKTADDVIGANGYIRERSGVYSTNSGNLTLLAVDGNRLTIYNTCEFTLYFATVRKEPAADGLYQIVEMCSGGKRVVCEKALYTDSVEDYDIFNADGNYPVVNNEISINQGSANKFIFGFSVKPESVPVFTDELLKGYMKPAILDRAGNDISDYFNFDEGELVADADDANLRILRYSITPKSSALIDSDIGIYFGYFALTYDNGKDEPIVWQFALRNEHIVNLYKPKAMVIDLAESDLSKALLIAGNRVELNQSLTDAGEFKTTIKVTLENGTVEQYDSVNEFLNKLVGSNGAGITITDQKQRKDTLNGKWMFAVEGDNANIISFTPERQSFSFKNTDSDEAVPLTLIIKSSDGNATLMQNNTKAFEINFSVKSTGISKILYDSTASTYVAAPTTQSLDTSKVDVSKNGAKGNADNYIVLNAIVKFFCQVNGSEIEYDKISFRFNPQFYSQSYLSDTQVTDLFGIDGMLELYVGDTKETFGGSYTPDSIRSRLASIAVDKIRINKNFASALSIPFIVSDRSGAVNTAFNLSLTENISVTSEPYNDVYAGAENKIELTNKVTNINVGGSPSNITTLYNSNNTYYIVLGSDGRYVLTESRNKPTGAVGELSQGTLNVYFYDFWETPEKSFTVYFQPEGQNSYALNHPITFVVKRDLLVSDVGGIFYVLGGNNDDISKFAKITRHDGETTIVSQDLGLAYEFSDLLQYSDAKVQRRTGADFFFDYNEKSLFTTLTIKYGNVIFGEIQVEIQLVESNNVYAEIASKFYLESNASIKATTQVINNGSEDVEYLVIPYNAGSIWETDKIGDGTYLITPSQIDHDNAKDNIKDLYTYSVGETEFKKQNKLLSGINNIKSFVALKFGTSESDTIAFMHIPLIISSIGYDVAVYENGNVAADRRLETSLLRPEQLIENGIYNEINAGQLTTIINEYNFNENTNITKGGLYTLPSFNRYLRTYSLDTNYKNYNNLVKNINAVNGTVTLNHLATSVDGNVYVAFEYTLQTSNGANSEVFYYLLKVLPDVNVENSVYAYNGEAEYLTAEVDKENTIDFETLFGNNTLHNNEKRFLVNKIINLNLTDTTRAASTTSLQVKGSGTALIAFTYNGSTIYKTFKPAQSSGTNEFNQEIDLNGDEYFSKEINTANGSFVEVAIISGDATVIYDDTTMISTLKYTNSIESVQINSQTLTTPTQWNPYITFNFSNDFSKLTYIPKTTEKMTITVKHSYDSTSETSLSIEGTEQYYKFIINEDEEKFAVQYIFTPDKINEESENFELTLDNGAENKTYNLDINLLRKEESGSTIGTIIPNRLQISIIDGNEYIKNYIYEKTETIKDGEKEIIELGQGKFQVTLLNYISSDKDVRFAAYTEIGLLSVFTIHLKANVTYIPSTNENANVIVGGTTQTLLPISLYEDETEEGKEVDEFPGFIRLDEGDNKNIPYTIKEIYISGEGADFVQVNTKSQEGSTVKINGSEFDNVQIVSLTVADLISNKEIIISYVVNVEMDSTKTAKLFEFSDRYILQQNIIPKNSVTASGETIAGTTREIDVTSLYTNKEGTQKSDNTTIEISTSSSNPAFKSIEDCTITTGQVSERGTLELSLQVKIVYKNTVQTFYVNYSFVVVPSVKLEVNYPIPNKDGEMEFEYVENDVLYPNLQTFVSSNSIFGEAPRFVVYKATDKNDDGVVEYTDKLNDWQNNTDPNNIQNYYSVVINGQTNADVKKEGGASYAINETISVNQKFSFSRQRQSGSDAVVELGLTYNSVSIYYTVKVLVDSVQMTSNTVSSFSTNGIYEETNTTVNYETIYVDKTSTSNILEGGRLIYAQLNDTMASYANDYYFVFAGKTKVGDVVTTRYYASYPIFISKDDQSKNIYYDLGLSFNDCKIEDEDVTFEFYGLFLASSIEDNKIKIDNDKHRQLVKTDLSTKKEIAVDEDGLPLNLANNVFRVLDNKPQVGLANRVQLTYGYDKDGNPLLVDYNKYKTIVEGNDLSINNTIQLNNILKHEKTLTLARNDGSERKETFPLNYYYMASIDISMDAATATMAGSDIILEVEDEQDSLVSLFGLKHPTNDRAVKASDFSSGNSDLGFEVLNYVKGELTNTKGEKLTLEQKDKEILDSYLVKKNIKSFKTSVKGYDGYEYDYLYNATKINANGNFYDYSLTPLGAKNTGDYLLTRVTYKVGGFEKSYFVVVKVMPDYDVSYGGSVDTAASEADGTIISNYNSMKSFATVSGGKYKSEELTGLLGYLAITHRNTTGGELAVDNFKITMPVNEVIDARTFNNTLNLNEKVFHNGNLSNRWQPITEKDKNGKDVLKAYEYTVPQTLLPGQTKEVNFTNVNEIFFGTQYYYFEGVDNYGYKYRLYFNFVATKRSPEIVNSITIAEDGLFDLGAQYQELTLTATNTSESSASRMSINSSSLKDPVTTNADVQIIKFRGIEAWQYDADYTKKLPDNSGPYMDLENYSSGVTESKVVYGENVYKGKDTTELINTGDYLKYPNLNYMSIEGIKLYDPNTNRELAEVKTYGGSYHLDSVAGKDVAMKEVDDGNGGKVNVVSDDTPKWVMATADGNMFSNRSRSAYGMVDKTRDKGNGETEQYSDYHDNLWQIPRITDTNIFKGTTTATVRMVVTLKFDDGKLSNDENHKVEYCDCTVNINIVRKASIGQDGDSAVIDGKPIKLFEQKENNTIESKVFKSNTTGVKVTGLLNDTLEISAPANRTTTFGISLIRDEKELYQTSISVQNGESYTKTFYYSLSQYFGANVEKDDKILIDYTKPDQGAEAKFYYIYDGGDEKGTVSTKGFIYTKLDGTSTSVNKLGFTISEIKTDYIYVEDSRLLKPPINYYDVIKHYIAVCEYENGEGEQYLYRVYATYYVTAYVYKLEKKNTGSSIASVIQATEQKYDGPLTDFKGQAVKLSRLSQWGAEAFTLYSAEANTGITTTSWKFTFDEEIIKYFYFEIAESSDSSDSKIGRAYIDSNGTIILGESWQSDQYIKVNIKTKVSGPDRDIENDADSTFLSFETLSLSEKRA